MPECRLWTSFGIMHDKGDVLTYESRGDVNLGNTFGPSALAKIGTLQRVESKFHDLWNGSKSEFRPQISHKIQCHGSSSHWARIESLRVRRHQKFDRSKLTHQQFTL